MADRMDIFYGIPQNLVQFCLAKIEEGGDTSHNLDHILDVAEDGVFLAELYELNPLMFKLAALVHDIFQATDREYHHILSSDWARNHLEEYGYSFTVAHRVARMCRFHRKSLDPNIRLDAYEEVFARADFGIPGDKMIKRTLQRAVAYSDFIQEPEETRLSRACVHLRKKYGSEGYARRIYAGEELFAEDVQKMQTFFNNLTCSDIARILAE